MYEYKYIKAMVNNIIQTFIDIKLFYGLKQGIKDNGIVIN